MRPTIPDPSFLSRSEGSRVVRPMRRGRTIALHLAWLLGTALLVLIAAGCSGQVPGTLTSSGHPASSPAQLASVVPASLAATSGSQAPQPSATSSPAWTSSPSPFPMVVTDDEGTKVTIAIQPQRIVSLTPAITETLFALDAGARVVATTDAPEEPPAARSLPHIGSFGSIDLEKIVALRPDLVLAGGNGYTLPEDVTRMRALGLPVVVVYAPSVAAVLADIVLVGQATGSMAPAVALAASIQAQLDRLAMAVRTSAAPRVFYEIDATKAIFGPADHSFLAEMISLAGGKPITTGSDVSFEMPLEQLVAADPQVILLGDAAYGVTKAQVGARPGWATMSAVRSGAIRSVNDLLVTRPGPRLAEGLRDLVLAIHPGITLP
jgi:iron complex transport system substrate-binding protein